MVHPKQCALALLMLTGLLAGCATAPPNAPTPPTVVGEVRNWSQDIDEAVADLAATLAGSTGLGLPGSDGQQDIAVDSFIDYASGEQNEATRTLEARLTEALRARRPGSIVHPLGIAALDARPLVLLGAVAPVTASSVPTPLMGGRPGAYRVWTVLVDSRTGRIAARAEAWLRPDVVNPTPTPFVQAAPAWTPELTTAAYLRSTDRAVGEPADSAYVEGLPAQALAADGTRAFEARQYDQAAATYARAEQLPGGQQMRVLNGAYLSYLALGRAREAADAFTRVVDHGLARGRLAIRFVFQPGSTEFWRDRATSGRYPFWLNQVAERTASRGTCLLLVGHASPTGTVAQNNRLSLARAERVRRRLVANEPILRHRTNAAGHGAREAIVGTGADDITDLLDRRVEFMPVSCVTLPGSG